MVLPSTIHGSEIISYALVSIGELWEEAAESKKRI